MTQAHELPRRAQERSCRSKESVANNALGFTLIELAVVLTVVALFLGGLLLPLSTQVGLQRASETEDVSFEVKEALMGFAVVNGRLPCPAISATNGQENFPCTSANRVGFIPWETLGTQKADAWGQIFRYSVTPAFAGTALALSTAGDIRIRTRNESGGFDTVVDNVPAAIISHGSNGYGGFDQQGTARAAPSGADEQSNANNNDDFVTRPITAGDSGPGGEFDDVVAWISANVLFNRLVMAEVLP